MLLAIQHSSEFHAIYSLFQSTRLLLQCVLRYRFGVIGVVLAGKSVVSSHKNPENSQLSETDNTKRSDLIDVDNGNKRVLRDHQDGQTGVCLVWTTDIVRRVMRHKDSAPDRLKYRYPKSEYPRYFKSRNHQEIQKCFSVQAEAYRRRQLIMTLKIFIMHLRFDVGAHN